jgi:hypothetical protein
VQPFCNHFDPDRAAYTRCALGGGGSTQRADEPQERRFLTREEVLARAKPLPPFDEMVMEDLTEQESAGFLQAINEE